MADGVAHLRRNRPEKKSAFDAAMLDGLFSADHRERDDDPSCSGSLRRRRGERGRRQSSPVPRGIRLKSLEEPKCGAVVLEEAHQFPAL